ncbi:hypothetical protein Y1Q_0004017 [Alligator mississippiensis]|uniref:Uncharacterized protein n=1 Tax=Alligator mississippiensis TaxID=8496 RepID=A0A151PHW6_ALLMI|nr:hypothetical protein Y1Q_0004017 [Alligator mississippiensis]
MESLVARLEGCGDSNLHFEEVELVKRVESCSRPEKVELIYTVTESEGKKRLTDSYYLKESYLKVLHQSDKLLLLRFAQILATLKIVCVEENTFEKSVSVFVLFYCLCIISYGYLFAPPWSPTPQSAYCTYFPALCHSFTAFAWLK